MADKKIKPEELQIVLVRELGVYSDEIVEKVYEAVSEISKKSAQRLRATDHVDGSNIWRDYPKGWTSQVRNRDKLASGRVYNKDKGQLTHLLENGHVIKNGTRRVFGKTRAFVHIAPVEKDAVDELEKRIMEAIKG